MRGDPSYFSMDDTLYQFSLTGQQREAHDRAAKVSICDQKALHRSVKLCQHWFSLYFFFFPRRLLFSTHEFTYSFRPWSGKPLACSIAPLSLSLSPLLPPPLPERAGSGQSSPRLKKAAKNSRFTLGISLVSWPSGVAYCAILLTPTSVQLSIIEFAFESTPRRRECRHDTLYRFGTQERALCLTNDFAVQCFSWRPAHGIFLQRPERPSDQYMQVLLFRQGPSRFPRLSCECMVPLAFSFDICHFISGGRGCCLSFPKELKRTTIIDFLIWIKHAWCSDQFNLSSLLLLLLFLSFCFLHFQGDSLSRGGGSDVLRAAHGHGVLCIMVRQSSHVEFFRNSET